MESSFEDLLPSGGFDLEAAAAFIKTIPEKYMERVTVVLLEDMQYRRPDGNLEQVAGLYEAHQDGSATIKVAGRGIAHLGTTLTQTLAHHVGEAIYDQLPEREKTYLESLYQRKLQEGGASAERLASARKWWAYFVEDFERHHTYRRLAMAVAVQGLLSPGVPFEQLEKENKDFQARLDEDQEFAQAATLYVAIKRGLVS